MKLAFLYRYIRSISLACDDINFIAHHLVEQMVDRHYVADKGLMLNYRLVRSDWLKPRLRVRVGGRVALIGLGLGPGVGLVYVLGSKEESVRALGVLCAAAVALKKNMLYETKVGQHQQP